MQKNKSEIRIYQLEDNQTEIEVRLEDETVWLSRKQMAELFDKDSDTIGLHLKHIYQSGELDEIATTEESSAVQLEGSRKVKRKIKTYNLDAIISDYAYALDILDRYDYQNLDLGETSGKEIFQLTYNEAIGQIAIAKKAYGNSELFGREKDESLKSSLSTIYQTFDGKDLYPSVEEKDTMIKVIVNLINKQN